MLTLNLQEGIITEVKPKLITSEQEPVEEGAKRLPPSSFKIPFPAELVNMLKHHA